VEYRYLGKTGLRVSELCLGTQTFGWCTDEAEAFRILDRFAEAGGNFFDSADSYNQGQSEAIFGRWLKSRGNRSAWVAGTKVFFPVGEGPNDTGLSRKHLVDAVETSLGRLQTEYIDLYQLHCWDMSTPLEETIRTLDDLVRDGKVRYVGVSNLTPSQLMKGLMLSRMSGWVEFASAQLEYSLLVRSAEWELLPLCREEGVGFLPWSPLAGGWLTGKYRRDRPIPSDSRAGRADRREDLPEHRANERAWGIIETLNQIARDRESTPAHVALRWVLQQKGVAAAVFGARTLAQLEDNLGAVGWTLREEEMTALEEASAVALPYPYDFISRYSRRR